MKHSVLLEMRTLAKRQLLAYRRNKAKISGSVPVRAPGGEDARWITAVDDARRLMRDTLPEKERAMCRLFGLDTPIPRYQPVRERIIKLSMEYCVSISTMYAWREDMITLVLMAAAGLGMLRPYGLGDTGAMEPPHVID